MDTGVLAPAHKQKKRKVSENKLNGDSSILQALQLGDARDLKMMALRTLLEFGSDADKRKAAGELRQIAFESASTPPAEEVVLDEVNVSSDDESTTI